MIQRRYSTFIRKVWESRPGGFNNKKLSLSEYVQDSLDEVIKKRLSDVNNNVAINSGGLTCQLQSLDVSLNKPFKEKWKSLWSNWMVGATNPALTRRDRLRKPSIILWYQWVVKADPNIIIKAFNK